MPQNELSMRWPKDWCDTRASPATDMPAPIVSKRHQVSAPHA